MHIEYNGSAIIKKISQNFRKAGNRCKEKAKTCREAHWCQQLTLIEEYAM